MKHFLFATFLLLSNISFSQSNKQLHHIKPQWKLGDIKKVHTESFTKVFIKDSLFNNTEATADYNIKVIDTLKNYTLLYFILMNLIRLT
jgi:mannitol-1-phosphate/altronate dehydrogenase